MSPAAEPVIRRLDAARQKWWFFTLLSTSVLGVCVSFGTLLLLVLLDALFRFSQPVLAVLAVGWVALTGSVLVLVARRLLGNQRSLEGAARRVEAEFPELNSDLINLLQLASDTKNEHRAFCEAAVRQAAQRVGRLRFDEAAYRQSRWQRFIHCMQTPRDFGEALGALTVLIVLAMILQAMVPNWSSAATRLLRPWEFVPSVGSVEILDVQPKDCEVLLGSSLEISVRIRNQSATPYQAVLFLTPEGEAQSQLPMQPDEGFQRYTFTVPTVLKPFEYRLEVGDSQTPKYKVTVRARPAIEGVEVSYRYPEYLGRSPETFAQKHADLEAPQYSEADLAVRPSVPVASGYVMLGKQRLDGYVDRGGTVLLVRKIPMLRDGTFTIHLVTEGGHRTEDPRINRIRVVPDDPPTVELVQPAAETSAAVGGNVAVTIRAADKQGLGRVRLEMKVEDAASSRSAESSGEQAEHPQTAATIVPLQEWTDLQSNSTVAVRHYRLELAPEKFKPGQIVSIRAVAWDRRRVTDWGENLQPQEAASSWRVIRLVGPEAKAQTALEQIDSLRGAIWKLLDQQLRARAATQRIVLPQTELAQRKTLAGKVRQEQIAIQKGTQSLADSIAQTQLEERAAIKRVLSKLALGEMLAAVEYCDAMTRAETAEAFTAPVAELAPTQDKIIEALRKLLMVASQAETEVLAEMRQRTGADLPDDTRKKFEEARDKLEEFLKQQKKIIEASENLAKMPVEDFTEKEEQLLREMAAVEDEWAKFMNELHTDLSKLPEQDFANPSMLKELVEVQVELKMAADALLKKSLDIAVPLEQLGYERAEELVTNFEKWLPDTPDRERWSQEESLTDQDKEAPMAELPGELEDMIGELMEEEEDLFDEMEDISSSAADSLDRGAGWDAADGPISNMSAKGVTGNRLPNTSEIGGRSGEGRTGKSSGEFVGDEAVGKGGRKTPSRLTPDPYVKGQIQDHSKEATGGATGGGKESGQGNRGLEGPLPANPGQRELERLAGKQAALRNKAESIDPQLQILNYHRTDLKNLIDLMAQVEADLRAGRYQSALRQRKVLLEGLGNLKQYLEGEFHIRQDTSVNLPADIQKEILGSMRDPSPPGWEELNRQYFDRLTSGGNGR